jgi:pimeloyl-ACP methyl ester carboxylesterase
VGGFGLTIALTLIGFAAAIVIAGVLYQVIGLRRDARSFPAPGRLVQIGDTRVHLYEQGQGNPPVVFDAGIAATSLSWQTVQPEVAKFARAISYDRAGLGWSDSISESRDIWRLVEELRAVLENGRIPSPRILVAHSFGGLIAIAYALRYPEELRGLVLVDPASAEEWASPGPRESAMLRRGIVLSRFGELLAGIGVVRLALDLLSSGARTLPKLIARASSGRSGSGFIDRMVGQIRKLPPEVWPMIQAHWCDPKCFRSAARQLAALPSSSTELLTALETANITLPIVLLSAADASPAQRYGHERLVARCPNARFQIVEGAGHWIMLDQPKVVLDAIRELVFPVLS